MKNKPWLIWFMFKKGLVSGNKAITQGLGYEDSNRIVWPFAIVLIITGDTSWI